MGNEEEGRPSIKRETVVDFRPTAIAGASFEAMPVSNRTSRPLKTNTGVENLSQRHGLENEGPPAELDPRRMKRIISNRASAQKSRLKKLQYVVDMERKMKALQGHIAMLSPQVAIYENQKQKLQMENKSLTQQISAITCTKELQDEQIEKNKAEINRLRQVHLKQCYDHYLHTQSMKFTRETPLLDQIRDPFRLSNTHGNHEIVERGRESNEGDSQLEETAMQGRRPVEYKWMPTPGLWLTAKPSSNNHQAGSSKMVANPNSDPE